MTSMMRGGKNNPRCRCCNDSECDGFRTREKRVWKSEAREMTQDELPNSASFGVYDELNTIDPIIFKVSNEEWEQINKALNEPAPQYVIDGLKRLFGKNK